MTQHTAGQQDKKPSPRLVSLKDESLARKLVLAFGFMSFIPILIVVLAFVNKIDMAVAIYAIIVSVFVGYFVVARKMIGSVVAITKKVRKISTEKSTEQIKVNEENEIGELARAFNRITQELEHKISSLESSRELVKRLLSRIGTAIISYESIDNLLTLVIENAVVALEAQMGSLMLIDGETHELYVKAISTRDNAETKQVKRMAMGEGIAGWVAKEGRPMHTTGLPNAVGLLGCDTSEKAIVCVPLKLHNRIMGVMTILRDDSTNSFTDDDELLIANIGSQIAVAVENYRLNLDIEQTYVETIMALAMAVEAKDPYSAGHSKRVGYYSKIIGEEMGLDPVMIKKLNNAGVLHDVGKIGIKDAILLKSTPLNQEEEKIMHEHPVIGAAIVKPVKSLREVGDIIRSHHEHFDGTGYPQGLKGEEIPFGSRIIVVADTYDAMITDRPYRKRLTIEAAKTEIKKHTGTQFDPKVVEAFLKVITEKENRLAIHLSKLSVE